MVPPGEIPDETAHTFRACALSQGEMIGYRRIVPNAAGVPVVMSGYGIDAALPSVASAAPEPGRVVSEALNQARRRTRWSGNLVFAATPNTAIYPPVFYIPAAAACLLGRDFGAGPFDTVALMRGANLLTFLGLGLAALAAATRLRLPVFAALILPGTLHLAASVNQDGLLIATSAYAVALLTRSGRAARIGAAVLLGAVCLAKPPYLPLLAVLVLPEGPVTWRTLRSGVLLAVAASLPALAWSVLAATHATAVFQVAPYAPGPLYVGPATSFSATSPAEQAKILLADPSRLITIPLHSLDQFRALISEVIGVLGQLDIILPGGFYRAWLVALGFAVVFDVRAPQARTFGFGASALIVLVSFATVLGIYWVQYLTWTHVGMPFVVGMEGRYLLPPLLVLALAWPSRLALRPAYVPSIAAAAILGLGAVQFVIIPIMIVRRFYMQ